MISRAILSLSQAGAPPGGGAPTLRTADYIVHGTINLTWSGNLSVTPTAGDCAVWAIGTTSGNRFVNSMTVAGSPGSRIVRQQWDDTYNTSELWFASGLGASTQISFSMTSSTFAYSVIWLFSPCQVRTGIGPDVYRNPSTGATVAQFVENPGQTLAEECYVVGHGVQHAGEPVSMVDPGWTEQTSTGNIWAWQQFASIANQVADWDVGGFRRAIGTMATLTAV